MQKLISHIILSLTILMFGNHDTIAQKANFGRPPKVSSNHGINTKTYSSKPKLTRAPTDWTKDRIEVLGGMGPSIFLGDLGGQNNPGKPFLFDYEPTTTRYSFSAGTRYYLREYHSVRAQFSYASITGADSLTYYPNRRYRNLNFKSPIYELAGIYELHILKPEFIHFAGARSTKVFTGSRIGAYGFGGIALIFFNPKGQFNGQWYSLAPLNTEGQGLPGGPKDYSRLNLSVPLGGGVYWLLNYNFKLGLEFGYRWSMTDYLDDASTYYYDNQAIEENYGKVAALFANPSVLLDNVPDQNWYTKNQPRGGSNSNDTYMFVQLTLSKSLGPSITNKEFKPKKKKKAVTPREKKFSPLDIFKRKEKAKTYKSDKVKNKKRKFKAPSLKVKKRAKSKPKIRF